MGKQGKETSIKSREVMTTTAADLLQRRKDAASQPGCNVGRKKKGGRRKGERVASEFARESNKRKKF